MDRPRRYPLVGGNGNDTVWNVDGSDMSGAYGLTIKQEKFAERYLEHRNATRAYKEAGYSCKTWPDSAIWSAASRMLKNSKVAARINAVQYKAVERAEYTLEQAIKEAREDREHAKELGQLGAAVSGGKLAAQLAGHLVERRDNTNRDVSETPDKELRAELARLQSERDKRADTVH